MNFKGEKGTEKDSFKKLKTKLTQCLSIVHHLRQEKQKGSPWSISSSLRAGCWNTECMGSDMKPSKQQCCLLWYMANILISSRLLTIKKRKIGKNHRKRMFTRTHDPHATVSLVPLCEALLQKNHQCLGHVAILESWKYQNSTGNKD